MAKTASGLVAYVKAQVGHPYWYGCFGQISTYELYMAKKKQYPSQYQWECKDNQPGVNPKKQLGVSVFDCVNLIKGYLWSDSPTAVPKYNAAQDVSANGMYEVGCSKKGKVNKLKKNWGVPDVPGVLVFKEGHVGVYIGDGLVVEAMGHKYGVCTTVLKDRPWTKWGYCKWIDYAEDPTHVEYYPRYTGNSVSLVDALESLNIDGSRAHRKKIAEANGIKKYLFTAKQNTKLLKLLKDGKLKKA